MGSQLDTARRNRTPNLPRQGYPRQEPLKRTSTPANVSGLGCSRKPAPNTPNPSKQQDGKTYTYGETKLSFSPAVAHGSDDHSLGWVIMATVECGDERFMFAPDVQGPMSIRTAELILAVKPSVFMMGGPPLYLEGGRVSEHQIKQALLNLGRIAEAVPLIILEHHALRDEAWRAKLSDVLAKSDARGHRIMTGAEYAGKENLFLEANRKRLFDEHPVSEEFKQWMKTLTGKSIAKPPLSLGSS